jgi:hypothetical protein
MIKIKKKIIFNTIASLMLNLNAQLVKNSLIIKINYSIISTRNNATKKLIKIESKVVGSVNIAC